MLAEDAKRNPNATVRKTCAEIERVSAASESVARTDVEYSDGSVLVITSRAGKPSVLMTKKSADEPDRIEDMA